MAPGDEKQQRRKHDRAQLVVDVRIRADSFSAFIEEQATTLSAGGMFIATAEPKPVGSTISFEFVLGDEGSRIFAGTAEVRWARSKAACRAGEKPGMGVQFLTLDDDSRRLIDGIVESRRARSAPKGAPRRDAREIFQDMDENELLAGLGEEEPGSRPGREASREDDIDTALGRLFGDDDEPAEIQDTGKFPPPADVPPMASSMASEESWLGAEDVDHVLDRAIPLPAREPDDDLGSLALPNEPDAPAVLEAVAAMDLPVPEAPDAGPPADTVIGTAADAYFEDAEADSFEDQVDRAVERFREKDGPPATRPGSPVLPATAATAPRSPGSPVTPPPTAAPPSRVAAPPAPVAKAPVPAAPAPAAPAPGAFAFEEEPYVAARPSPPVEEVEEVEVYFEDDGGAADAPPSPPPPAPPMPERLATPPTPPVPARTEPEVAPPPPPPPRAPAPPPSVARAADLSHSLAESLETMFPEERAPTPPVQRRLPLEPPPSQPRRAEEVSAASTPAAAAPVPAPRGRRSAGVVLVVVGVAVLAGAALLVMRQQGGPAPRPTPRPSPVATKEAPTPEPGSDPGGEAPVEDPGTPTVSATETAPLPGSEPPPTPVEPPPAGTATPSPASDGPTRRLLAITTQVSGGTFVLTARGDGRKTAFQTMKLDAPPRYVVDVPGVKSDDRRAAIDVEAPMIARVRVGHDADKVRFVLDIVGSPEMDVTDENGTLRITLR